MGSDFRDRKCPHRAVKDFNPRSPCGERRKNYHELWALMLFQSTLPVWGATPWMVETTFQATFQSTLPVWGATNTGTSGQGHPLISIHAPRVGSDGFPMERAGGGDISIHAPRVGSDADTVRVDYKRCRFQSTLPVWGATSAAGSKFAASAVFQSTLPVWGATPFW